MKTYELIAIKGFFLGQVFPLKTFPVMIGRAWGCDIQLPEEDEMVSRYHCEIDVEDEQLLIRDTGSSNGTYVNGYDISGESQNPVLKVFKRKNEETAGARKWVILGHGDEITIEQSTFTVNVGSSLFAVDDEETIGPDYIEVQNENNTNHLHKIDHYRVIKKIGSGAAGDVFQVQDIRNGNIVALKMLKYRMQRKEEELKRFLREIDNLKKLDHPNIIRFLDTGSKSGVYYFTTEYCNEGSLIDKLIYSGGDIGLPEALLITIQVLEALEYAHAFNLEDGTSDVTDSQDSGLVHRDIKPGNILLHRQENGEVIAKLADFGLSKVRSGGSSLGMLTKTGTVGGTVEFLCRQQMIDYKHVRGEVDLWSAIAVLYYMLTAEAPRDFFDNVPPYKTILTQKPVPIRDRLPDFPETFAAIIDRALDDSSALYYKTAKELKRDLKRIYQIVSAVDGK